MEEPASDKTPRDSGPHDDRGCLRSREEENEGTLDKTRRSEMVRPRRRRRRRGGVKDFERNGFGEEGETVEAGLDHA